MFYFKGEYCDEQFLKTTQKELLEALNMTQQEMDSAAYNILQAETHLLGGDLLEIISQQHELQKQQKLKQQQENNQQITSQNIAQQLNPSTICDIEEEQTADAGAILMMDSHSPINFSDEEEDTKL